MWTPFLKTTPARISCAVCFNSYWNSGFTGQVWTEGLHIKNCGGQGCIYTRSDTRSRRGQYEVSLYGLSRSSPWASEARLLHLSWQKQRRRKQQQEEAAAGAGGSSNSSNSRRQQQQQQEAAAAAPEGSSRRRKQQQQEEAAAAASSKQQAAASSSKQQKAAAAASSKQQPAAATSSNQHVPPWKNDQI